MSETHSERLLRAGAATIPDMGKGKPHTPASPAAVAELRRDIDELRDVYGYSYEKIGKALNVSHQIVSRWHNEAAFPRHGNLERLQNLLRKCRTVGQSRNLPHRPIPPATAPVVTPTLQARHTAGGAEETGEHMAQLIALRELPRARYPELEVCLWYHRADIAAGLVAADVIAMAQGGRFEPRGAAHWDAPRWWDELRAADQRLRDEFGPSQLLPSPQPPTSERRPGPQKHKS